MSAFNFGHDWGDNAWNVTVRRLTAAHLNTAIVVWEGVLHDLLFEDITLTNSTRFGVRYENGSDYRVVFRNVVSSGSGTQGFYSSLRHAAARRHALGLLLPLTIRTASIPRLDRAPRRPAPDRSRRHLPRGSPSRRRASVQC